MTGIVADRTRAPAARPRQHRWAGATMAAVSYLLRVYLQDRPGSLGLLAVQLGSVGADILSLEVVERADGYAVDDLVVEVAPGSLPDTLITAAEKVKASGWTRSARTPECSTPIASWSWSIRSPPHSMTDCRYWSTMRLACCGCRGRRC